MKTFLRALKLLAVACASLVALAALRLDAAERARPAAVPRTHEETAPRADAHGPQDARPRDGARQGEQATAAAAEDPVDVLDRVVRARFHNHIGFGMARIATERRFQPETEEERQAVRAVKRSGMKVGLFLVGRRVLSDATEEQLMAVRTVLINWPGRTVSGPIFLSGTEAGKLPAAAAMQDGARRAMLSFAEGGENYEFEAGGWKTVARPVRAVESCLQCHAADIELKPVEAGGKTFYEMRPSDKPLKAGDPLGAMLYVYRRKG
ncbi:MAG TPA: hypothetical protein VEY09_12715 [Pyrinomonadaceae bacterium]|nr:hypothetical protein [Pyrinomonadaceae bacterium]